MRKFIKFNKNREKPFMYPNGTLATIERILADYPALEYFTHIVETDENEEVFLAVENLSKMRSFYKIDSSLSENEAILAIQEIINTPEEVLNEPTAEERIAAALEYQNMMTMEDTIEEEVVE